MEMSLLLPASDSPLRELFDVRDLANLDNAEGRASIATFRQALDGGREFLAGYMGAKSVNSICLRADGELWLIEVTRKTWRRKWNFGKL
jgi:hypothetical protein